MVKLIVLDVKKLSDKCSTILEQIAPMYVEKYNSKKHELDKLSELAAGYLLLKYLGVNDDSMIRMNDHCKPYLTIGESYFNLSHSGDYVALGISDCEIGIDIEKIREYSNSVAVRVFAQDKQEIFESLEGEEKDLYYSKSWTEVEALVKCRGVGFDEGWKGISTADSNLFSIRFEEYYISVCLSDDTVRIEEEIEIINDMCELNM